MWRPHGLKRLHQAVDGVFICNIYSHTASENLHLSAEPASYSTEGHHVEAALLGSWSVLSR